MGLGDAINNVISYVSDLGSEEDEDEDEDEQDEDGIEDDSGEDGEVINNLPTKSMRTPVHTNADPDLIEIEQSDLAYVRYNINLIKKCKQIEKEIDETIESFRVKIAQAEGMREHTATKRAISLTAYKEYISYLFAKYQVSSAEYMIDSEKGGFVGQNNGTLN